MKKRQLGNSDLYVTECGFGCMSLDVHSSHPPQLLQEAFNSGINFFDTADLYNQGENEKLIGTALKNVRHTIVIATKVGNQWKKGHANWNWNPTKKYILKAVEESLYRLKTDYIDLYQLHGGTIEDPIDETIEAFEILKEQGKIREYGISSIRPNVIREWCNRSNIVSVMMQYSLFDRRPEEVALNLLKRKNISVIARGTLSKGLLAGKEAKAYLNYSKYEVAKIQSELSKVGNNIAHAIQFVLKQTTVASTVLGIRTPDQLRAIIHSKLTSVNNSDLINLSNMLPSLRYEQHR